MTEVFSGNDIHMQGNLNDLLNIIDQNASIIEHILIDFFSGPDITAVKSITKCIRILSPGKFITSPSCFVYFLNFFFYATFPISWNP